MRHFTYYEIRIPRKLKKKYLGSKLNKTKLRKLINSVEIVHNHPNDHIDILPYEFCPKCGCKGSSGTGNMASYPEHWEIFYCNRCNSATGSVDNSRFVHILEEMLIP